MGVKRYFHSLHLETIQPLRSPFWLILYALFPAQLAIASRLNRATDTMYFSIHSRLNDVLLPYKCGHRLACGRVF